MCQMCDEIEADLRRMGLIEEADKVRAERHPENRPASPASRPEPAPATSDARR